MYIYHCLCFQSIQFTWKQVGQARWCYTEFYICGSCNLVSIFFSSCDISKTVFVIKYDGFYLSICWGYLLWERVVFLTWNLFLWWICFCTKFPVLFLERQKTKHYFWKMHDNLNFSLMIVWRGIYCFNNCYFWLSDLYGFYLLWLQCNLSYIWMFLAIYGSSVAVFSHITYIKIVWGCNLNMYELSDLFEIDIFSSIGSNFEPYI